MAELLSPGISFVRPIEDERTLGHIFEIIETMNTKDRPLRVGDVLGLTIISSEEMVQAAKASQEGAIDLYSIAEVLEKSFARAKNIGSITARAFSLDAYGNNPDKDDNPRVGINIGGSDVHKDRTTLTRFIGASIKATHKWEPYRPVINIAYGSPRSRELEKGKTKATSYYQRKYL